MSSNSFKKVAVIDVGSNSIKLIVASLGDKEPLHIEHFSIRQTRIGEGITGTPPQLDSSAIERGTEAIAELVSEALPFAPEHFAIVATSAVRDAINRDTFILSVESACGKRLRVLTGDEEALYIGKGLQCDPNLVHLKDFTLLDLGGGSMECIRFQNGTLSSAHSLQLGCVRITNLFKIDRDAPLPQAKETDIEHHTIKALSDSNLNASGSPSNIAILTGGASAIIADRFNAKELDSKTIRSFKNQTNESTRLERIANLSIPQSRSDIFPAAVTTIVATLQHLNCNSVFFSRYNLRYGIAQALLNTGNF